MPHDSGHVGASRSVLVDALTVLGQHHDALVLVGGWVPELLYPERGHIGSLDVDLAIDVREIAPSAYGTLLQKLIQAGYRQTEVPNRFLRDVTHGGISIPVKLELLAGQYGGSKDVQPARRVQEMQLAALRGIDLAFEHFMESTVTGTLPDGGLNTVPVRIARVEAFIAMKGIALSERKKEKDAYDIYFCLRSHSGGTSTLADKFRGILHNDLVEEGLRGIRQKFETIDHAGPVWAARVAAENGEDYEQARRAAFELVRALLDRCG